MTDLPTISLCMIAKNEEDYIGQCIKSVLPIVSEVILVDTGSTDRTIEIAKELGARVYEQPWEDDFSQPRNYGISKAKGDWILVLDADEVIAEQDLEKLKNATIDRSICWQMTQRHYSNDHRLSDYESTKGQYPAYEKNYQGFFSSGLVRLFPNKVGIHYQGRIHELVEQSIYNISSLRIALSEVPIHHYGHTEEVKQKKNKHGLYGPLGKAKLNDNPTDWKGFFELGVEYNKPASYEESVLAFKKSLQLNPHYLSTWVNLGYVLCELARYDEATTTLQSALKLDPKSHEAHCNLGVVHLRTKKLNKAEFHFREAIKLNPQYLNAYFNLSNGYANSNRLSEAANVLRKVIDISPKNARARSDLGTLYLAIGELSAAESFLTEALTLNPQLESAQHAFAQLKLSKEKQAQSAKP